MNETAIAEQKLHICRKELLRFQKGRNFSEEIKEVSDAKFLLGEIVEANLKAFDTSEIFILLSVQFSQQLLTMISLHFVDFLE